MPGITSTIDLERPKQFSFILQPQDRPSTGPTSWLAFVCMIGREPKEKEVTAMSWMPRPWKAVLADLRVAMIQSHGAAWRCSSRSDKTLKCCCLALSEFVLCPAQGVS